MAEQSLAQRNKKRRSLKVDVNNETAAAIVQQLQVQLTQSFSMIAQVMTDQNRMLTAVLQKIGNADVLQALTDQNKMLAALIERPVKVEAGSVELNMPPRASRFEFELNAQGVPIALVVDEG